jgi:hypothetical protein
MGIPGNGRERGGGLKSAFCFLGKGRRDHRFFCGLGGVEDCFFEREDGGLRCLVGGL